MAKRSSDIIVGLDIGTTKIAAVVAERTDDGLDVIGVGTQLSRGLKKGVIVTSEFTRERLRHQRLASLPPALRQSRGPLPQRAT